MELAAVIISSFAVTFSIFSFLLSYRYQKHMQQGAFYFDRNIMVEGMLKDIPEALSLYGINIKEAEKNGISNGQIAYLISSLNAMIGFCKAENITIKDHLQCSDYRKNMFDQASTLNTWDYARFVFSEETREAIDNYLSSKK